MLGDLVSVILPTFNRAHFLGEAMDSALAQSHRNLELIIIDDGSTDGTRDLVRERSSIDSRIRYIPQKNAGVSAARNTGLRAARGAFIALLDSDDIWKPWKVDLQLSVLRRRSDVGMVWTDMEAIDERGNLTHPRFLRIWNGAYKYFHENEIFTETFTQDPPHHERFEETGPLLVRVGSIYSQMIMGNLVHTSTVLFRRERFEHVGFFDESLRHCGADYNFHLRTCREGPVALIDVPSIRYRCGASDQLSRNGLTVARNFYRTISEAIERDSDRITLSRSRMNRVHADAHAWIGELAGAAGERQEALSHLKQSLLHDPLQARAAMLLILHALPPSAGIAASQFYRFVRRARAWPARRESSPLHNEPAA